MGHYIIKACLLLIHLVEIILLRNLFFKNSSWLINLVRAWMDGSTKIFITFSQIKGKASRKESDKISDSEIRIDVVYSEKNAVCDGNAIRLDFHIITNLRSR